MNLQISGELSMQDVARVLQQSRANSPLVALTAPTYDGSILAQDGGYAPPEVFRLNDEFTSTFPVVVALTPSRSYNSLAYRMEVGTDFKDGKIVNGTTYETRPGYSWGGSTQLLAVSHATGFAFCVTNNSGPNYAYGVERLVHPRTGVLRPEVLAWHAYTSYADLTFRVRQNVSLPWESAGRVASHSGVPQRMYEGGGLFVQFPLVVAAKTYRTQIMGVTQAGRAGGGTVLIRTPDGQTRRMLSNMSSTQLWGEQVFIFKAGDS